MRNYVSTYVQLQSFFESNFDAAIAPVNWEGAELLLMDLFWLVWIIEPLLVWIK